MLDEGMVMLQHCPESFHTKKLCSKLYSIKIKLYLKNKKSIFEPPFEGFRGNVCTPSIARWKVRGRLLILIIELFSLPFTVETL